MTAFGLILSQIKARLDLDQGLCEEVAKIVSEICGMTVLGSQVTVRKSTAKISLPSTAKMALYLKRDVIVRVCKERGLPILAIV